MNEEMKGLFMAVVCPYRKETLNVQAFQLVEGQFHVSSILMDRLFGFYGPFKIIVILKKAASEGN